MRGQARCRFSIKTIDVQGADALFASACSSPVSPHALRCPCSMSGLIERAAPICFHLGCFR